MPVVDFSLPKGGCDLTLQKFLVEADPAADANTYKVYVLMNLASRAEAEVVEAMLPGLADSFDRAGDSDNWKAAISVKPSDSLRVVLTAKEAGVGVRQGVVRAGEVVIQGTAELVEMRASQSKRSRAVLVRFVFCGQGAQTAERLADNLSRSVGMSFERLSTQTVLPFATAKPTLRPGMIVAASAPDGVQVVGRLVEIDGDELSLQEAGTEITVAASDVISAFAFAQDGDTQAALQDYADRCERRELPVNWRALVEELNLSEGRAPVAGVVVTAEHVEAATRSLETQEAAKGLMERIERRAQEEATAEPAPVLRVVELPAIPIRSGRKPRAAALA